MLLGATVLGLAAALICGCSDEAPTLPGSTDDATRQPYGVRDLTAVNDPLLWGTVHLTWSAPDTDTTGLEVLTYVVVCDPDGGDVTEADWPRLVVLDSVPATAAPSYTAAVDDTDGVPSGVPVTIAVRPHFGGDLGWGRIVSVAATATRPHRRSGQVRDDHGAPLAGVTVRLLPPQPVADPRGLVLSAVTGADGRFAALGPLPETLSLVLQSDSPDTVSAPGADDAWFDYRTPPLAYDPAGAPVTLHLVTRRTARAAFLPGLTDNYVKLLQNQVLADGDFVDGVYIYETYKFADTQYPLTVHVPADTSGLDLDAATRAAMVWLNAAVGEEILVEATGADAGRIRVTYDETNSNVFARTYPAQGTGLGDLDAIPEYMRIRVNPDRFGTASSAEFRRRVLAHELGHTLGIYKHFFSGEIGDALMYVGTSGSYIYDEEIWLLKSYRNLPGYLDMNRYEESLGHPEPF